MDELTLVEIVKQSFKPDSKYLEWGLAFAATASALNQFTVYQVIKEMPAKYRRGFYTKPSEINKYYSLGNRIIMNLLYHKQICYMIKRYDSGHCTKVYKFLEVENHG